MRAEDCVRCSAAAIDGGMSERVMRCRAAAIDARMVHDEGQGSSNRHEDACDERDRLCENRTLWNLDENLSLGPLHDRMMEDDAERH